MSRAGSFVSAVPAVWSRWGPILAVGLGLLWFVTVGPGAIATGQWFNLDVMRAHNTQDIARLLLRAASERPELWPEPEVGAELQVLFVEQQERKRREWHCHAAVERTLDNAQLTVMNEKATGPGIVSGFHSTTDELHAVNEVMASAVGSAPAQDPPMPFRQHLRFAERGRLMGLLYLAEGEAPGLRDDQARLLLPVCMDAELVSKSMPETDRALALLLSPELRDWMAATPVPVGRVVSTDVPRCCGLLGMGQPSEIDAVLHVLREGPESIAHCDLDWDEPAVDPRSPAEGPPQGGSPQGGPPEGGHPQGGPPEGGHPQGGHPQGGHPQGGHPEGGHPEGGHPEGGQPQGGHSQGWQPQGRQPEGGQPPPEQQK